MTNIKHYLVFSAVALTLLCSTAYAQPHADTTAAEPTIAIAAATPDTVILRAGDNGKVIVVERNDNGTTRKVVVFKPKREPKAVSFDVLLDIGFNTYADQNMLTGSEGDDFLDLNTSKSVNVAVYPFYSSIRLTKTPLLNLETGLGLDWGNYRFEDGWTIANENGQTVASDKYRVGGESTLSKSKLMTLYMNVPLMLTVKIPVGGSYRKGFSLSAGVMGGIKLGSHTKVKYNESGSKVKDNGSFNLNLLRYDLRVRVAYRGVGLYANYQMSPMFESGNGPKLFPYAIGVSYCLK